MSITLKDFLAQLEGTEKTAEQIMQEAILGGANVEKVAEEVVEETVVEETPEAPAEEVVVTEEVTEEAPAEEVAPEVEKTANAVIAARSEEELVKIAVDMGKIAAHTFYETLVAMGVMPVTNADVEFPPVSAVSLPSDSPVVVAADAASTGQTKTASVVDVEFLTNFYNKTFGDK
jgi:hypothetical protein